MSKAKRGDVIKGERGQIYVAMDSIILPDGHSVINARPHEEGTEAEGYHYKCNSEWCKCNS